MSTLANADLSSDSENDCDYVPTSPKRKNKSQKGSKRIKRAKLDGEESDSATSSSSSDDEDEIENDEVHEKIDEIEERKRKAREEFERMKAELSTSANDMKEKKSEKEELVEVKRARRFAGETIYEIVKLKKDDPETIAYLSKRDQDQDPNQTTSGSKEGTTNTSENQSDIPKDDHPSSIPTQGQQQQKSPITTSAPAPKPAPRPKGPPIRRKPRQSLEAMSAALDKGKKMTTLEKSRMDWKSHTTSTTGLSDELALNRKNGGGYLDKKDFLDRVGERRSNTFDSKR
ncbi:hypothetical protein I203_100914 [Kwoniella mangroviensis CBS 8507]|uniref:uncharacterized protein n=1 Tax=Kwoniella mangroviensis CBS 8507 TaxID=1296122 RepID=UPI00080D07E7|nr:uncharacterized protein I203_02554 [Kwoniella mangroviensis CBS 8507]OCF67896.1 hypothetical protein I203_02554 [Kwoniella mangroviensis CBS 8507]